MSIYEELCKLHSARRDAGAPDAELETLVKALHQLEGDHDRPEDEPTLQDKAEDMTEAVRPMYPLTKEGIQKWADDYARTMNESIERLGPSPDVLTAQSVLAQLLANKFASDYREWGHAELVDLVCNWDLEGCRGWMQYPIDELIETMLEEATEIRSDRDRDDAQITTVEQLVEVLENW